MIEEDDFAIRAIVEKECPFVPDHILLIGGYSRRIKNMYLSSIRCFSKKESKHYSLGYYFIMVSTSSSETYYPDIIKSECIKIPTKRYVFYTNG